MPINLGTLLYAASGAVGSICPGANVGQIMPYGSPRGSKHEGRMGPKISKLIIALDNIIQGKVAALMGDDGEIYVEHKGSTIGSAYISSTGDVYYTNEHVSLISAMFLKTYLDNAEMSGETDKALAEYADKGHLENTTAALLSDIFYYEAKEDFTNPLTKGLAVDPSIRTQVQQAVRTKHLKPVSGGKLAPLFSVEFSMITFDGKNVETKKDTTLLDWYDDVKQGALDIGFTYTPEQAKRIRPLDFLNGFVPNAAFRKMATLATYDLNEVQNRLSIGLTGNEAIGSNYLNMILVGKPGTGKTTTAEALSAALGLPIYTVTNTKNTEEDNFQGMTKVVEGGLKFTPTPFLEAYENGGIIVLEEFNLPDPAVMQGAIGQAIEYPFILMKDGYEEVHRHPLCVIIATMNTAVQGARLPNEALTSRAPVTIIMEDPNADEFIDILVNKGYEESDCKKVYKAYQAVLDYLENESGNEELVMCVTLRHCLGCLKLMKAGFDIKEAIKETMIGSIAIRDLKLANEVFTSVIEPKKF